MRSLNNRTCKAYLSAFGYNSVKQVLESVLGQVDSVVQAHGHELQRTIQQLLEDIPIQLETCRRSGHLYRNRLCSGLPLHVYSYVLPMPRTG